MGISILNGGDVMRTSTLKAIQLAITNEIEGYEFYRMSAAHAPNDEVKDTFISLMNEERKHVEWLNELYMKISKDEEGQVLAEMPEIETPKIFSWDNLDVKETRMALTTFGIGMTMEKASMEFYQEQAREAEHSEVKQLFRILVAWEKTHYDLFHKEYETLKELWWHKQEFAPF